jgi:hypothetical protein
MSQENVEIVRRIYDHFSATQEGVGPHPGGAPDGGWRAQAELLAELDTLDLGWFAPDVVVDMSRFEIWPERHLYEGHEGVKEFLRSWLEPWETYKHHLEPFSARALEAVGLPE